MKLNHNIDLYWQNIESNLFFKKYYLIFLLLKIFFNLRLFWRKYYLTNLDTIINDFLISSKNKFWTE